jgi:hypothetical protein
LSPDPLIGGTTSSATGTAALLLQNTGTLGRQITVGALAAGASQRVLIGAYDTSGTAQFSSTIVLNRDVTLVAAGSGATKGTAYFTSASSFGTPTTNVTVGAPSYEGTVLLARSLSTTGTVSVQYGRLSVTSNGFVSGSSVAIAGAGAELKWNSGSALTSPLDFQQGTLSGTGQIGTAVTVGASAILSPGNSPGIQQFTSGLTWAGGGQYLWEINDWSNGTPGTTFDQIQVTGGGLAITSDTNNKFTIKITSLTSGNVAGAVPGWGAGTTPLSFTILTAPAGITGFDTNAFNLDTGSFQSTIPSGYKFKIVQSSSTALQLQYGADLLPTTYTLSASRSAPTIIAGGTSTITAVVANTGTGSADQLAFAGLNLSGGSVSLSTTSGTVAAGGSGTASGIFTSASPAVYTLTPGVSSATNLGLGGAATATGTTPATVTVLDHATASLASTLLTSTTISLGTWNYETNVWTTTETGTAAFAIHNLLGSSSASLTAGLVATGTAGTVADSRFNTTFDLATMLVAGGTSANYYVTFDTAGLNSRSTYTATYKFQTSDENLPGKQASTPLTVTAVVTVVPEPATAGLAGIGVGLAVWAMGRRRDKKPRA